MDRPGPVSLGAQDATGKVRSEYTERVFKLYDAKLGSFHKTFGALIGFALLFFFIVQLPYSAIQVEQRNLTPRVQDLATQIEATSASILAVENASRDLARLKNQVAHGPTELRDYIENIESTGVPPEFQASPVTVPSVQTVQRPLPPPFIVKYLITCGNETGDRQIACWVRAKVLAQIDEYEQLIFGMVPVFEELKPHGIQVDVTVLKQRLPALRSSFGTALKNSPDFWRTFAGKEVFYGALGAEVAAAVKDYQDIIRAQQAALSEKLDQLTGLRDRLQRDREALVVQERKIEERLNQIEFPFGKIPVGLAESVQIFPVLLAIGFLIIAELLAEATALRSTYHQLYQAQDPTGKLLTDQNIALVAPLWIDPTGPWVTRILRWMGLLVPVILFFFSSVLVVYNWSITGPLTIVTGVGRWTYGILYVLCLGLLLYAIWQLTGALREGARSSDRGMEAAGKAGEPR